MIRRDVNFVTFVVAKVRFQRVAKVLTVLDEFLLLTFQRLSTFGRFEIGIGVRDAVQRFLDRTGDFFDRLEKFAFLVDILRNAT